MKKSGKHWMSGALPFIHLIASAIDREKLTINDLNLFPVPDGDTGTNLATMLTKMAGDIAKVPSRATPKKMLQAIAHSANMRARGNSGTILAAIISGMAEILEDTEELTPELLTKALENANTKARSVVGQPVEGTMLTVIREMARAARHACNTGATEIDELTKPVLIAAMQATEDSAEIMRKILARENVGKDAGAFGLSLIVKEAAKLISGEIDDPESDLWNTDPEDEQSFNAPPPENEDWQPGTPLYCTEFVLHMSPHSQINSKTCLETLASFGNSEVFNVYRGVAKIHVHTDTPWLVFSHFSQYGELSNAKIDNMRLQTEERAAAIRAAIPQNPLGTVAIAAGNGIKELLLTLGVDVIVDGGQTNNPEVGEIYEAIRRVNAEVIIVLPGNKNVILAAEQACMLAADECISAFTIPTLDLPQNIAALIAVPEDFCSDNDIGDLRNQLAKAAKSVRSASITTAIKDYSDGNITAMTGQFISLIDDKIEFAYDNILDIIRKTTEKLLTEDSSIVTVYLGTDFMASAKHLKKKLKTLANVEVQIIHGGQPIYPAIISVE